MDAGTRTVNCLAPRVLRLHPDQTLRSLQQVGVGRHDSAVWVTPAPPPCSLGP